jgi:hypothetical protein
MKELKEYDNVFCNMLEQHNKIIVPILRNLGLSSVKVRNTKIVALQKQLQVEEKLSISVDVFAEYLVTHHLLLPKIDQVQLNNSYELIKSRNKENIFIGINCVYSLIESVKKEMYENMDKL